MSSVFISDEEAFAAIPKVKDELKHYQQISFAHDGKIGAGFILGNMWGNYAESGYGVCLVFNKHYVIRDLQKKNYGLVIYKPHYDPAWRELFPAFFVYSC